MARTDGLWNSVGTYLKTIFPTGKDILINGVNKYLNWGTDSGSVGYGIRDNAGTMEFKNNGGAWAAIGSGVGSGDMTKAVYDVDNNGVVDNSQALGGYSYSQIAAQMFINAIIFG